MERNKARSARLPADGGARLRFRAVLERLRALPLAGVLLYHAEINAHGGFLGVESFFVLSGFLITALLLAEWREYERIDLQAFWLRRARRLLPALFLMLLGTLALVALLLRGEASGLRDDILAALAYVMNWHLVASGQSYFDPMVRPSLLQHLWSLAIEEQFYLLWPLLFAGGMRLLGARGLLLAILAVAAASAMQMAWLYHPGADPSRIYYGTDTRASALLIGAALAMVWTPGRARMPAGRGWGVLLDGAGLLTLGGLGAAYVWLYEAHPLLYRGGFLLVALATAAVIWVATHPAARALPALLAWRPLRWVGLRSYALYLWHWPIFTVTRPYVDVPLEGWPLLLLRLVVVGALAELSYRLVELPVRHGALDRWWQALRAPRRHNRVLRLRWLHVPSTSLLLVSTIACASTIDAQPPATAVGAASAPAPTVATPVPTSALPALSITAILDPTATAEPPTVTAGATAAPSPTVDTASTAVVAAPTQAAEDVFDPELAAKLQGVLDRLVADGTIPGAVLAVEIPGQPAWTGASGVADRQSGKPMEPSTNVRIASISKMFTAAVVLQLAEEGKIDLDAPMTTWLPELVPNGDRITVRGLLQHTTGLYDYLEDRNFVNRAYRQLDHAWAPRELVDYATKFPASFKPNTKGNWDYSSTNYVILGMLVEQVTGRTLAQEMRSRIFEPLELRHTFFAPDETIDGAQARGYSGNVDQTNASMTFVFGTANIVSTAGDVRLFADALFNGRLLKPDTLAMMLNFVHGKGQYKMPKLEYGLGVMRNVLAVGAGPDGQPRAPGASTVMGHIGGYGGFRSAVWYAPESGITIALGVNQAATDPNILATRVFNAILTHQGR
jgi:peptidoglycan/LPS O-acetylase OafA/YrhL/CubicO group peptidase (beta-lactamase class C family)